MLRTWFLACAVGLLTGCGEPKAPDNTFADPQVRALEKARAVQKQVDRDAARRREAVDRQAGSE